MSPRDIRAPDAVRPGFTVRCVVLDLDGTCLDAMQRLHPRVRDAVRSAARRLPVIVATGRMYLSALPWARELHIDLPLVCYQGAVVRDIPRATEGLGELLFEAPLAPEPSLRALRVARRHRWHYQAYQDEKLLCEEDRPEAHLYARIAQIPITFVDDLEPLLRRGTTKAVCVIEDAGEVRRCIETMSRELGASARVTRSMPQFVEIINPAVSKAAAVELTLGRAGLTLAEAVAVGDAPNDLEMLAAAGFAVAVATAAPEVLAVAGATCAPPDRAGVADVLEALALC
jgi:Cof subfamily protein (haloacid dehalogenase superfamily)